MSNKKNNNKINEENFSSQLEFNKLSKEEFNSLPDYLQVMIFQSHSLTLLLRQHQVKTEQILKAHQDKEAMKSVEQTQTN